MQLPDPPPLLPPTDEPENLVASFFSLDSMEDVLRGESFDSKEYLRTLIDLFRGGDPKVVLAAGKQIRELMKDNALLNGLIGTASQSKELNANGEEVRTVQSVTSHRLLDAARARRTEDSRRLRPRVIPPYTLPTPDPGDQTPAAPQQPDGVPMHGPSSSFVGVPQPDERVDHDGQLGPGSP